VAERVSRRGRRLLARAIDRSARRGPRSAGFGWATLRRAKVTLEVEHRRTAGFGADGHWLWRLPDEHPLRNAGRVSA
jgi:hypothetical protein